jgi:hypothetical protein
MTAAATVAMTEVTGEMTEVTDAMTAATAAPAQGCCGDSAKTRSDHFENDVRSERRREGRETQ